MVHAVPTICGSAFRELSCSRSRQTTLASSFVGQSSYSFYSAIKGRALFAFEALGQVLPAALPRNAIAPSVADPNS
jgi:hypothetical protein